MTKIKVSIIVPIYNAEKTIKRCLDSIINQTYKDLEILLINDGSKDNSLEIIKKYKDKRIKIIDKKNEGVAKTRNLGIKKASGQYIMFIDNDDYIDKEYVQNYVENIDNNDVIMGGYKRVSSKKVLFQYSLKQSLWSRYIVMAPWAKLYNKKFLIDNDINFFDYKIGEDVYFNFLVLLKTNKIKTIPTTSYNWFYNDESVSNTVQKGLNTSVDITKLLNELVSIKGFYSNQLNIYYINRYITWYLLFSGRYSNSKSFIKEYNTLKKWKKDNKIYLNISPFSKKISGESLKNRFIVFTFNIIEKLKLIKIFSKIYCKGKDK